VSTIAVLEGITMARRRRSKHHGKTCKYGFRKGSNRCRKTPRRRK
jgi:hypothetical protein